MADLVLSVVQEPSDDVGYLAGLAVGDDMIVAVGGATGAHPTVLASSNARDFDTRTTPRGHGLRAVLVAADAVWTCGEGGQLAMSRDHGASWTEIETGTTACLAGLACAADGSVWVVGDGGFAARLPRGGEALERVALGAAARLTAVVAVKREIVILGDDGAVRRWHDGTVTEVTTGSARALTGLVTTRGSWIVVGEGGFIGRSPDGAWWSRVKVEAAGGADLQAVAALASGELVAVGARGVVLVSRDDGRTWAVVAGEPTAHLWSVARLGGGALIGGDEGLIAKLAPAGDDAWADRTDVFSSGRPLDAAFVAGPVGFITGGGLATYMALVGSAGGGEDDTAAAEFRARYGVAVPPEVVAFRALTAGPAGADTFRALRAELAPAAGAGTLFERAVLQAQRAPHGPDLVEAFCGVFALGTLASGDSYQMELAELDGARRVLHLADGVFSGVVADSLDSLVYLTAIVKAGTAHEISRDAYRIGLRKLRGKVAPPPELAMQERDPDFVVLEPKRRDTEFLDFRSRWIRALLAHEGTMAEVTELFAPHLNQVVPPELLGARYDACEKLIPTALYATWRAYLFDEPELPHYLEIGRRHAAQLVRDSATLIGELLAGRNELGTIPDVRGWLAAFRALDLDPRRTAARAPETSGPEHRDVEGELARTPPAAWGDLAWRWLDDGAAHRSLLATLGADPEAGRQLTELATLGALSEGARAIALPRLAAELGPALEAVLVGSLVRDDDVLGGDVDEEAVDEAPGWDAIDRALAPIYQGQEPRHYGTVLPARLGGNDPLHGISAYVRDLPVPHFHFVTYGFTDLFRKETDDPDESGFGFELTLRLVRAADEQAPPPWALNFLQNLARYVFGSGNRFAAGHKMGLNGPIALDSPTKITAILFANDAELGAIDSPFGAARFVQIVGITDDEYKLIQEWSTTGLVDMLKTQWPYLTTDLGRASLLDDPLVAAEVRRRVAAEGSAEDLSFGGDLAIAERAGGGVALRLGALYAASFPRAMRGRLRHQRTYELRGRGARLRLAPSEESGVVFDEDGATLTLAPALVAEIEEKLLDARSGTYAFEAWAGLEIVVTPTFIRDQSGAVTDVRGIADPGEARRLVAAENGRLEATDGSADADDEQVDGEDEDEEDEDEDEDADEDADVPPAPAAIRAALTMTGRALALAPDDDDTQFTHAMLLLDLGRTGDDASVDKLLELLPSFEESTRLNIATRMGKTEHPQFGEAVDLALGDSLPERILAGSTTPTEDGSEISSFGDAAEEIYEELGQAILAHAPDRMARFVSLLPDSIPLLAKLAYHAAKATLRDQAITLYERVVALPMPDDGDERTEYLRALNNLCIHLHAAGQLEASALVADRAQLVAHENPFIYHAAACAYVGVGDFARALQQVRLAIEHRYENLPELEHDADLGSLRDMPEFQAAFRDWHARQEGN